MQRRDGSKSRRMLRQCHVYDDEAMRVLPLRNALKMSDSAPQAHGRTSRRVAGRTSTEPRNTVADSQA